MLLYESVFAGAIVLKYSNTPKPSIIRLDDEYRLHAEGEPAIVYKGFELYAHHGKYLNSKVIT